MSMLNLGAYLDNAQSSSRYSNSYSSSSSGSSYSSSNMETKVEILAKYMENGETEKAIAYYKSINPNGYQDNIINKYYENLTGESFDTAIDGKLYSSFWTGVGEGCLIDLTGGDDHGISQDEYFDLMNNCDTQTGESKGAEYAGSIISSTLTTGATVGVSGAVIGAAIGALGGPIGAAAGAVIGTVVGGVVGAIRGISKVNNSTPESVA